MERLRYLDFELKLERKNDQYIARIVRSPAGEATGVFTLPFSEDRLELLVQRIGHFRGNIRSINSEEMANAHELGGDYSMLSLQVMFALALKVVWI